MVFEPRGIRQLSKPALGWLYARPLGSLLAGIKPQTKRDESDAVYVKTPRGDNE